MLLVNPLDSCTRGGLHNLSVGTNSEHKREKGIKENILIVLAKLR